MNFSPQQEKALRASALWLEQRKQQVFRLFGYAGTGKTTLAQELASGAPGPVYFAAYTGKAASVMRQRGCADATTIHRLIYRPAPKSGKLLLELQQKLAALLKELDESAPETAQIRQLRQLIKDEGDRVSRPSFTLNPDSPLHSAALVVIDECSMVDEQMGLDLLSFGKPVLVLGDPAQLPPVRGEGFFTSVMPDVMLTEIHRQARDNPIIRMASDIREGTPLRPGAEYGTSAVLQRGSFTKSLALSHDQVIVGRNATRTQFNKDYRTNVKGSKTPLPCVGDKLVCLRNNHGIGILNGELWEVTAVETPMDDKVPLALTSDDGRTVAVQAHGKIFRGEPLDWWERKDAEEFDYGYALTCHKSQGSQWKRVLVFDESFSFRENARKWLYTAVTRASESVTVIQV